MVLVNAIWFRRIGNTVQLLVEREPGKCWFVLAEEPFDANFSHCVHATGINKGTPDPVTMAGAPGTLSPEDAARVAMELFDRQTG